MASLKDLQKHRKDILLAEVAAWLHDWQKSIDMAVASHWKKSLYVDNTKITTWQHRGKTLKPRDFASSLNIKIQVCGETIIVKNLIETGKNPSQAKKSPFKLVQLLGHCHGTGHIEKELEERENEDLSTDWSASPFGGEFVQPTGFLELLLKTKNTLVNYFAVPVSNRKQFLSKLYTVFYRAWGDTRRPINEVTLWDWSSIVAALYKAEIARWVLTGPREPAQIAWRLLSVRTNGLEYILSSSSIPDLLARKELLTDASNRVQKLLEEEYPLGLEVYRDENGSIFVVPNLQNPLDDLKNPEDNNKTLREYILEAFRKGTVKGDTKLAIDGEIELDIQVSRPWTGQEDKNTQKWDLPPIGKIFAKKTELRSNTEEILLAWEPVRIMHNGKTYTFTEEVCSVCGLRPLGYGATDRDQHYQIQARRKAGDHTAQCPQNCQTCKAISRKMCVICEERRADRAKMWAEGILLSSEERFWQGKPDTIWLDEVADVNGRLALIVGCFGLEHWLSGTLVQSLAVRNPENVSDKTKTEEVAKNPSFARLRRIWETTRRFWQDVAPTDTPPKELRDFCHDNKLDPETLWEGPLSLETSVAGKAMAEKRHRIFLQAENTDELAKDLGSFHAYEMVVQGRKVAVLWVPPKGTDAEDVLEEYRGGFWVIENLDYLKNIFGKPFDQAVQTGDMYEIYEPSEYGRPGRRTTTFVLKNVVLLNENYTPLVPILAEPRTFMALVPADKALEVVRAIKIKYEREMGKVRNRLPLHLGIIFADAHQPLRIILDAGRRMLKQEAKPLLWEVICLARKQIETSDSLPSGYEEDKEKQFKEWHEILLKCQEDENRKLIWYVPALMGDGQTEDFWYPFVFLKQKEEPKDREIYYRAHNPWNADHSWLVHVSRLKSSDIIYFTPATLDFIWLDHSGTRFEIVYDENSSRLGTLHRPYLLDELGDLGECWKKLEEGLSLRQILRVRNLIETNRAEWFENPRTSIRDEMFRKFCRSVLVNAEWKSGRKPDDVTLDRLTHWAVTGFLADTVELHHHIMKHKTRT